MSRYNERLRPKKSCSLYRLKHRIRVQLIEVKDAEDGASVIELLEDQCKLTLIQYY